MLECPRHLLPGKFVLWYSAGLRCFLGKERAYLSLVDPAICTFVFAALVPWSLEKQQGVSCVSSVLVERLCFDFEIIFESGIVP